MFVFGNSQFNTNILKNNRFIYVCDIYPTMYSFMCDLYDKIYKY